MRPASAPRASVCDPAPGLGLPTPAGLPSWAAPAHYLTGVMFRCAPEIAYELTALQLNGCAGLGASPNADSQARHMGYQIRRLTAPVAAASESTYATDHFQPGIRSRPETTGVEGGVRPCRVQDGGPSAQRLRAPPTNEGEPALRQSCAAETYPAAPRSRDTAGTAGAPRETARRRSPTGPAAR